MLQYETSPLFREISQSAVRLEGSAQFPPRNLIAQLADESAWFAKVTGNFNFAGITRSPEIGPAKFVPTTEEVTLAQLTLFRADERASETRREPLGNGKYRIWMSRWFASYPSLDVALNSYVGTFINSPQRYKAAWQVYLHNKDADAFLVAICKAGYATGEGYQKVLLEIAHQSNVQHAIEQARIDVAKAAVRKK